MHDHDQRFKTLIREFFAEFLLLFFKVWAERLDCSRVEWLENEVFPDPPTGDRRAIDLLAKVPCLLPTPATTEGENENWLALVHIEIESPESAVSIRARMHRYYTFLRAKYAMPVLPIVMFLKVGLDGIGTATHTESFWDFETLRFQFLYVGLPGLNAVEYLEKDNWLGVALTALMKIPKDQIAWLGAEALCRIREAPLTEQQRFLLGECVDAYLPLDDAGKRAFESLLASEKYSGVRAMNKTTYEKGIEKGIEKGVEQGREIGRREVVRELLIDKFGTLSSGVEGRLEQMSFLELVHLGKSIRQANSLEELNLQ